MKKEQLKRGDRIECCGIVAIVIDNNYKDGNFIKVLLNNECQALINKDWLNIWKFSNPIKDNRIVSDRTFAVRFKNFIKDTMVNDACSSDEKEYLLNVANRLLNYQIDTAIDKKEIDYLKRLNLL
jgi:hypothetical protein